MPCGSANLGEIEVRYGAGRREYTSNPSMPEARDVSGGFGGFVRADQAVHPVRAAH
jgi:hypothetical protein